MEKQTTDLQFHLLFVDCWRKFSNANFANIGRKLNLLLPLRKALYIAIFKIYNSWQHCAVKIDRTIVKLKMTLCKFHYFKSKYKLNP